MNFTEEPKDPTLLKTPIQVRFTFYLGSSQCLSSTHLPTTPDLSPVWFYLYDVKSFGLIL